MRNHLLKLPHRPMGCFSSKRARPHPPPAAREVTAQGPPSPVVPQDVKSSEPSSQRSRANSGRRSPQLKGLHMHKSPPSFKSNSTPDKPLARIGGDDLPPAAKLSERHKTKSSGAPSDRRPRTPTSAGEYDHGWSAYLTDNHKSTHCQRQLPGDHVLPVGRSIRHCSKCFPTTSSVFSSTLVGTS